MTCLENFVADELNFRNEITYDIVPVLWAPVQVEVQPTNGVGPDELVVRPAKIINVATWDHTVPLVAVTADVLSNNNVVCVGIVIREGGALLGEPHSCF